MDFVITDWTSDRPGPRNKKGGGECPAALPEPDQREMAL